LEDMDSAPGRKHHGRLRVICLPELGGPQLPLRAWIKSKSRRKKVVLRT
jgi:hypothetical protein